MTSKAPFLGVDRERFQTVDHRGAWKEDVAQPPSSKSTQPAATQPWYLQSCLNLLALDF